MLVDLPSACVKPHVVCSLFVNTEAPAQHPHPPTHMHTQTVGSSHGGIVSLLETFSRSEPEPLLRRLSPPCQEPLFFSLTVCAADADKGADPAGTVTSFSTADGCCLAGCAARLKEVRFVGHEDTRTIAYAGLENRASPLRTAAPKTNPTDNQTDQVVAAGCWGQLLSLLCNDTLALPAGQSWLELPESDPRRARLRRLSFEEMRVAYDIAYLTSRFQAGM
jgi:hypothetical protein